MLGTRVLWRPQSWLMGIASFLLLTLAAQAADPLVGTWEGTVTETGVGTYVVSVTIDPGMRAGQVEFKRYPCGGSLSLIGTEGTSHIYAEQLTFGTDLCLSGLSARLTPQSSDSIYFEELIEGTANVYGTLYRIGGPIGASCGEAGTGLVADLGTCFEISQDELVCIQEAMQKYENSIAHHPNGCSMTCGWILHNCINNQAPLYDPSGARGCVQGMLDVQCNRD